MSVLVIAEAGVNHNGDEEKAFELVDAACAAGADIVKFQTFKAEELVTSTAQQCSYQYKNTGVQESQYEMLKRLELSFDTYSRLYNYCVDKNIQFLSTAFDFGSLKFLTNSLDLQLLKVSSGDLTNAPFLLEHARTGCDLIVSTGMASLIDVRRALGVIAFGLLGESDRDASREAFEKAFSSDKGKRLLRQKVKLLHCTTEYPAPMESINLNAMQTLRDKFTISVGYSDHSSGITIPIAATALGAVVIEKHFTLDKNLPGPDHKASLDPDEFFVMVKAIRETSVALGDGEKKPDVTELKNADNVRKSIVASCVIEQGELFSKSNLKVMRPGGGMSPYEYWELLGSPAKKAYCKGDLIDNT